ncbi:MAG TPA: NUDIX hydrolase, partial [Candidatus Sulfotelmatobacter sp.]|nr:NUDIX hydrolase [Candidatus Sulfotelmatobacter sp.]
APPEDFFIVDDGDWAMICPRMRDGRFVLVEQSRPAIGRKIVEFPAGRIDLGETPAASIRRELIEETGHKATRLKRLGRYFADTGRLSNGAHLFFGDVEAVAGWVPEPGVAVRFVGARELDRLVADGRFDALHHVGLWLLVRRAGLVGAN